MPRKRSGNPHFFSQPVKGQIILQGPIIGNERVDKLAAGFRADRLAAHIQLTIREVAFHAPPTVLKGREWFRLPNNHRGAIRHDIHIGDAGDRHFYQAVDFRILALKYSGEAAQPDAAHIDD